MRDPEGDRHDATDRDTTGPTAREDTTTEGTMDDSTTPIPTTPTTRTAPTARTSSMTTVATVAPTDDVHDLTAQADDDRAADQAGSAGTASTRGADDGTSLVGATTDGSTDAACVPEPPRGVRVGTVVWGLVLAAIGAGLLAVAAGLVFDVELALIALVGAAGVALLVGSVISASKRRGD